MLTDYTFWYITRSDSGYITECAVRFFAGDVSTKKENIGDEGVKENVTRYRRTERLDPKTMDHTKNKRMKKDNVGRDVPVYTAADFGLIKTDQQLKLFLNKEMAKDKRGNNIPQQR